jgi:uncharacterized membrane protein YkvA (DUF1232 family)
MKYSQVHKIIRMTGLSPEQLSGVFGVSNMTLRRWSKSSRDKTLSPAQERAVIEGVYRLAMEGLADPEAEEIRPLLKESKSRSFEATLKSMGINPKDDEIQESYQGRMTMALFQIGSNKQHRDAVNNGAEKFRLLSKMGEDWKRNISNLLRVIKLRELSLVEKLIAYGALFYMIFPADLVPDDIPFFGFIDDYGFLIMATAYYASKFPKLFSDFKKSRLREVTN